MVSKALDRVVRERARGRCEYCRAAESASRLRFWIDHIISDQHDGPTTLDNLALACMFCNRHKGPNVGGVDPVTGGFMRLFSPRAHRWKEHFRWDGPRIVGTSVIGRVTVHVLAMNHRDQIIIRRALLREGLLPPRP